jgi:hypothetical protein
METAIYEVAHFLILLGYVSKALAMTFEKRTLLKDTFSRTTTGLMSAMYGFGTSHNVRRRGFEPSITALNCLQTRKHRERSKKSKCRRIDSSSSTVPKTSFTADILSVNRELGSREGGCVSCRMRNVVTFQDVRVSCDNYNICLT